MLLAAGKENNSRMAHRKKLISPFVDINVIDLKLLKGTRVAPRAEGRLEFEV